jgi:type VI secretion system protein ImpA
MATSLLEFDALTAPLDGDQPAGTRVPADIRKKMEDARKEFEPNPDDPSAPPVPKKPDWPAIVRLASDALTAKSKDLLAAVRLVEALTKRDGFAGLRDGLKLLRLLVVDCWDRIHPLIEEPEDIEARAGPFEWLNEAEGGAWFPTSIRNVPLVTVNGQPVCLQNIQDGKLGEEPLPGEAVRTATPISDTVAEEVSECISELEGIDAALAERMAEHAPSLINLRQVLRNAQEVLAQLGSAGGGDAGQNGEVAEGGTSADGAAGARPARADAAMTRADTYRQIALLADRLAVLEPHSPIPDLLRWAVKLGNMPFRELIQAMVRDDGVLSDIRLRFGIPEQTQSEG